MNQPYSTHSFKPLSFHGEGGRYFGIWAVNVILTILTMGLYYPWAKAAIRKFMWNATEMEGDRFVFHGTGKEMFRGFVIAYLIIISMLIMVNLIDTPFVGLIFLVAMTALVPFAIFGGWRYRMSRTSWRGIFFSFRGDLGEFMKIYFKGLFLTIITLGIYGAWMQVSIMRYLFDHTKLGNYEFEFTGSGGELFGINIMAMLLFIPTLGIYTFWYMANRFNFVFKNTVIHHTEGSHYLVSKLKGEDIFVVELVNMLLLAFTLGLAFPWVLMRTLKVHINSVAIPPEVDLSCLEQDADDFRDATGDDMMDILDVGLEF